MGSVYGRHLKFNRTNSHSPFYFVGSLFDNNDPGRVAKVHSGTLCTCVKRSAEVRKDIEHVVAGLSNVGDASTVTGFIDRAIAEEKSLLLPDTEHDFGIRYTVWSDGFGLATPQMVE